MYLIELQQISFKNLQKSVESAFYGGFSAKNVPKYREIPLFLQIWRYLKTTGNLLSGFRNTLETPNFDFLAIFHPRGGQNSNFGV